MSLTKDALYTIASDSLDRKYNELRRSVLADNPELVSFDVRRSGDDVTAVFGLRRGGQRYDFRLFGNKHDYYRLAMGVRVEETFALLAKVDPNVEAAGAAREGDVFRLTLRAADPTRRPADTAEAEPDAEAAASKPPAAASEAQAAATPPGTEGEVAVPGTAPSPAAGAAPVSEAPLRAPEATLTQADVERRVREESDRRRAEAYAQARKLGTPEAYRMFVAVYPDAPEAAEAGRLLRAAEAAAPSPAGEPARPSRRPSPILPVAAVSRGPTVDGAGTDAAWKDAAAVEVPVTAGDRTLTARIRAVHDGARFYLLAEWPDGTQDAAYRPWSWNGEKKTYVQTARLDDGFAVALYRGSPSASCKLNGEEQEADIWLWRAFWSAASGHADDASLRVSRQRLPQSNSYPTAAGGGNLWVRQEPDQGSPPWTFFIPVEFQGAEVPSYRKQPAQGSRGDVLAHGLWKAQGGGGTWVVEMSRALDTGHPDDVRLRPGTRQAAAFAVFDRSEKGGHAPSELIQLDIRGR